MLSLGKTKEPTTILLAALKFAAHKHRRQRRKDLEATPYINHPIEVAEVLSRIGGNKRLAPPPCCDFPPHHLGHPYHATTALRVLPAEGSPSCPTSSPPPQ